MPAIRSSWAAVVCWRAWGQVLPHALERRHVDRSAPRFRRAGQRAERLTDGQRSLVAAQIADRLVHLGQQSHQRTRRR